MATKKTGSGPRKTSRPDADTPRKATRRATRANPAEEAPIAGNLDAARTPSIADSMPTQPTRFRQEDHRDRGKRRLILMLIILLLANGLFWLLSDWYLAGRPQPPVAVVAPPCIPAAPVASTVPTPATVAPKIAAAPVPVTAPAPVSASRPIEETLLLGAGAGTTSRGGISLMFDHPVDWDVDNQMGGQRVQVDVRGIRSLTNFPRNLPMPPGVSALHTAIDGGVLKLYFDVKPGIQAYTTPGQGPASTLNIYFRTPTQQALEFAQAPPPQALATPVPGGAAYSSALAALESNDYPKALGLLQQSLKTNPDYGSAREMFAVAEAHAGNVLQAEQILSDGIKRGGSQATRFVVMEATLLHARGQDKDAVTLLKDNAKAAGADPNYAALLANLAGSDPAKAPGAGRLYRELVQVDPTVGEWWMGYGIGLEQAGQTTEARSAYAHALAAARMSVESLNFAMTRLAALKN